VQEGGGEVVTIYDTSGDAIDLIIIKETGRILVDYRDLTGMYLDRPGAAQLARILQHFADTGTLPEEQSK
jgi:hypothetical protein